ncbi:J domain-containing protein [Novosphingobium sp. PS1R-30]|uniref:J domain-containing protein n=1 Tax=Novosphingobium anseongense TaxID=3133436 RepID=A0ABU8S1Z6_9SPHN
MTHLYDILDIAPDAPIETINAAYRREAKQHHPDVGGDRQIFAALQDAIAVLRDPRRRAHYDTTGEILPELDTLQMEAIQALVEAFHNTLAREESSFHERDIVTACDASLVAAAARLADESAKLPAMQNSVAGAIERLLHNGIGEDYLGTSLKGRAASIEKQKANNERQALVLAMARDMLKSYGWRFEVSVSPSAHQTDGQTV